MGELCLQPAGRPWNALPKGGAVCSETWTEKGVVSIRGWSRLSSVSFPPVTYLGKVSNEAEKTPTQKFYLLYITGSLQAKKLSFPLRFSLQT